MRFVVIGLPVLLAMGYGLLRLAANSMVYYPFRYPDGLWHLQQDVGATEIWLTTRDGVRINAWWIAAPQARLVTVFFHGNGGNLTHRVEHMRHHRRGLFAADRRLSRLRQKRRPAVRIRTVRRRGCRLSVDHGSGLCSGTDFDPWRLAGECGRD